MLELLQFERRELPPEIDESDSPEMQDRLSERLKLIDGLIERLRREDQGVH